MLIDTGAAKDILYYNCFRELQFTDAHLQPYPGKLEGFTNHKVNVKATITLEVTLGQALKARTEPITFLVIDLRSSYNAILGAPALSKFGLAASLPYQMIRFYTSSRIGTVHSDPAPVIEYLIEEQRRTKDVQPSSTPDSM